MDGGSQVSANLLQFPQQSGFEFPQSFTEKYRPAKIAEFVGLEKPKRICTRLAENPRESAWFFLGPSGTGKTTLALALADAIPAELHHIPSQDCNLENITRVRKVCQYVPMSGFKFHLILVDEADRMSQAAQIACLSLLDATNFPPNTIFVFTGNSVDGLEARFMSRCHLVEFSSYGISKEVVCLLERVWDSETDNPVERPNFARIVKDSNNNVREALMRLETEVMSQ
jgi:replication-associated recombination protein RarA